MAGHGRDGRKRRSRRAVPLVEGLDNRELLSVDFVRQSLGPFLAPGLVRPRVAAPAPPVNAHAAINEQLLALLGEELRPIQAQVALQNDPAKGNELAARVLGNPFIHRIYTNQDTFDLLNSDAVSTLIGFQQLGSTDEDEETVTFTLTQSDIVSIGSETSVVSVPPSNGTAGFIAEVPTANIRTIEENLILVQIPRDQIPEDAPEPSMVSVPQGVLSDAFMQTGPILSEALRTSAPRRAPNAPEEVPGLRLVNSLNRNRTFSPFALRFYLRMFRIAADRGVLDGAGVSTERINSGIETFTETVRALNEAGTFVPPVPPVAPSTPNGPMVGSIAVTNGALRDLQTVAPDVSGLPLPGIGNFDGRIDAGFVFGRNGDFGLILVARGPLQPAQPGFASEDFIGGDLRIEVSNTPNIENLNGLQTVEGIAIGTRLMGGLESATNSAGVSTFAASNGYGAGFEFGTGVAYTQVIPLGNVFSILPRFPRRF